MALKTAAVVSPFLAAALLADYLLRGSYELIPPDPEPLQSRNLAALTEPPLGWTSSVEASNALPQQPQTHPGLLLPGPSSPPVPRSQSSLAPPR